LKSSSISKLLFTFFFISGFCSLLYQVVWTRLAYASFGINTPVLSVVLSVFMSGLALGSWWGGRWASGQGKRSQPALFLRLYGLAEFGIGLGAFLVPALFSAGERFLLPLGAMDSVGYLFFSALVILFSLLPWCFCMGATFPLMMAYLSRGQKASENSFSFLYTANVLGALAGTIVTALVLIEVLGFHSTLASAAGLNFTLSLGSLVLSSRNLTPTLPNLQLPAALESEAQKISMPILPLLFFTGFCSMALEVVWTRAFTIILKTQVYSFAALLGTYLFSTFLGSLLYRRHLRKGEPGSPHTLVGLAFASACLTAAVNDPRIYTSVAGVLGSIAPLCACLGYLTPQLIDRFSLGRPREAGRAYAINVLGCILGPLAASYLFLPQCGAKDSMLLLAVPFGFFFLKDFSRSDSRKPLTLISAGLALFLAALSLFWTIGFEDGWAIGHYRVLRRDYAATVVCFGEGMRKQLFVNGIGLTILTQDTKMMAHLPLAFLPAPPRSALDICFGMGTTFRSLSSWGIRVTAIELVPSVLKSFGFYFEDAQKVASSPNVYLVVDDGNRFLHRTSETFDVITIDPPPPPEAAGSSLLYSTEFYECAKSRLNPGGILQQWLLGGETQTNQAAARSISKVFPYVRAFFSPDDTGYHLLASASPIPRLTTAQLLEKIPAPAKRDLMEWFPTIKPDQLVQALLSREVYISALLNPDKSIEITNDRPYNEYYLLRKWTHWLGPT
jgi:spermidine synthase